MRRIVPCLNPAPRMPPEMRQTKVMQNDSKTPEPGFGHFKQFCDFSSVARKMGLEASAAVSTALLDAYGGPAGSPQRTEAAQELLMGVHLAMLGEIPADIHTKHDLLWIRFRLYLVQRRFWRVDYVPVVAVRDDLGRTGLSLILARDNGAPPSSPHEHCNCGPRTSFLFAANRPGRARRTRSGPNDRQPGER